MGYKFKVNLGNFMRSGLKIKKKGWECNSVLRYLSIMCKALGSITSTVKGKKTKDLLFQKTSLITSLGRKMRKKYVPRQIIKHNRMGRGTGLKSHTQEMCGQRSQQIVKPNRIA